MTIDVTLIDSMGTDLSVVNAARVSFGKKSTWSGQEGGLDDGEGGMGVLKDSDTKLINYLADHGHYSPFGHAFASFHCKAPIFVARQLVKHKFLRWNEISRRYVDSEPEFYVPDEWRGRSEDKKQGSDGVVEVGKIGDISLTSKVLYNSLLDRGVCPEQARMVLPQSTMTEWYWSGSLDAFADMCNLRLETDTQYETQLVAQQIDQIMLGLFPVSWEALVYGEDE
jgi:thymidylate synthase (FAD)